MVDLGSYYSLALIAITIGVIGVLDILTDVVAIAVAGISAVELGLLNSIAYVAYLLTLMFAQKYAEQGVIRKQLVLVLASLITYTGLMLMFINTGSFMLLLLSYMLCPAALAYARLATLAYIHEGFESHSWTKALNARFVLVSLSEGFFLWIASMTLRRDVYYTTVLLSTTAIAACAASFVFVKEPTLKIERHLFKVESTISYLESTISKFLEYTSLSESSLYYNVKFAKLYKLPKLSVSTILLSLIGFRLGNTITLTPLPAILSKTQGITLSDVLVVYGLSRVLAIAGIVGLASGVLRMLFYMLTPLAWLALAVSSNATLAGLLLGFILYVNSDFDVVLYSIFIENTRGRGTSAYIILGEIASFVGAFLSGYVYKAFDLATALIALLCRLPGLLILLKAYKAKPYSSRLDL